MFIISQEKVDLIIEKLCDPQKTVECLADVTKMLEIKEACLWRANAGPCCIEPAVATNLATEVQILQETVKAIGEGDYSTASSLLEDFAFRIPPERTSW